MLLTKLGERVFWVCLAIVAVEAVIGIYYLSTHINWVGDHYCWGTMTECYLDGK